MNKEEMKMEEKQPIATDTTDEQGPSSPEKKTDPSPSQGTKEQENVVAKDNAEAKSNDGEKPMSKKQLKRQRRWEKSQANKKRRKEQERELRRIKAEKDGRDLDAERQQQAQNQKEGKGWAKREAIWKETMQKADIERSFRVCFDCSFEDKMSWKETNSLGLQLRYTYAVNRKSPMPVYIDVCGLNKGGNTRAHLEKVEGFPDRWVGRAFHCYEGGLEEVYGQAVVASAGGSNAKNDDEKASSATGDGITAENKVGEKGDPNGDKAKNNDANASSNEKDGTTATNIEDMKDDPNGDNANTNDAKASSDIGDETTAENDDECVKDDPNGNKANTNDSAEASYPKLPPKHKFVYLTGDSPNTLSTLDNNTTYIIGGIVDRNRLKRAAIERAESISAKNPTLDVTTARLPLDEHIDFKASTRILTCNHVFEILQKYREKGYNDWKGAIMAVLPDRKDLEEKE